MLVRSLRALPAARPAVGLRGMTTLLAMRRVPAARAEPVAVLQQPRRWLAGTAFLDEADVTDRVLGCVKAFQKVDAAKVTAQSHFLNDLGLDSLDTVEVSASTTPLLPQDWWQSMNRFINTDVNIGKAFKTPTMVVIVLTVLKK